jgi:hypothetical protein
MLKPNNNHKNSSKPLLDIHELVSFLGFNIESITPCLLAFA